MKVIVKKQPKIIVKTKLERETPLSSLIIRNEPISTDKSKNTRKKIYKRTQKTEQISEKLIENIEYKYMKIHGRFIKFFRTSDLATLMSIDFFDKNKTSVKLDYDGKNMEIFLSTIEEQEAIKAEIEIFIILDNKKNKIEFPDLIDTIKTYLNGGKKKKKPII